MSSSKLFTRILDSSERNDLAKTRKWFWRRLYNMLSLFGKDNDWRFMNYGFIPTGEPFALQPADESDRPFIGLYQQAVDGLPLNGARVLEIGCGRGGGARYISRYYEPASVLGLDYSQRTVKRARKLNKDTINLTFESGDAEQLPFKDESFDIVINIESSHCYADIPAFANEVARVLKPDGWFSFADMRTAKQIPLLDQQLSVSGLELVQERELTQGVLAALDATDHIKRDRISRIPFGSRFMNEFFGVQGSILYKELTRANVIYLARRYYKDKTEK